jgi:hypothetical protein
MEGFWRLGWALSFECVEDGRPLNSGIIEDFSLNPRLCPLNLVIMGMSMIVARVPAIRGNWGIFGESHGFIKVLWIVKEVDPSVFRVPIRKWKVRVLRSEKGGFICLAKRFSKLNETHWEASDSSPGKTAEIQELTAKNAP